MLAYDDAAVAVLISLAWSICRVVSALRLHMLAFLQATASMRDGRRLDDSSLIHVVVTLSDYFSMLVACDKACSQLDVRLDNRKNYR